MHAKNAKNACARISPPQKSRSSFSSAFLPSVSLSRSLGPSTRSHVSSDMDTIYSDPGSVEDLFDGLPVQTNRVKRTYSGRHRATTSSTGLPSPPPSSSPVASPILRPIDMSSVLSSPRRVGTLDPPRKRSNRCLFETPALGKPTAARETRRLKPVMKAKRAKTTTSDDPSSSKKMVQMHLNLLPAHVTCKQCGMSYTRTSPDDLALHTAFHQSHMHGILLPSSLSTTSSFLKLAYASRSESQTIDKCVELVDAELSASTPTLNSNFQLFCRVSGNRITSFVLVQPLDSASPVSVTGDMLTATRVPTIIGVSRMWTSKATRGQGDVRQVLDYMLKHAIVGYHVKKTEVGFTQLSGSGQIVVRKWVGEDAPLLVYHD